MVDRQPDWSCVGAANNHSNAIKTDGTLWSMGYNGQGALGNGIGAYGNNKSSPIQIGALTDWVVCNVSAEGQHAHASKTDGTIWSWGQNDDGQLGHGDIADRSSPVQIGGLTTWTNVDVGSFHAGGLKTV